MPRWHREEHPLVLTNAESFAQLEQYQRQPLRQRTIHEVRAAQLHQVPPPYVIRRESLEVRRFYSQANLDEHTPVYGPHLTAGDRLAAEVIVDADHWRRKGGDHSRRQHGQHNATAFTVAAGYSRHSRQQNVSSFRRASLIEDDFAPFEPDYGQGVGEFAHLRCLEPGEV